MASRKSNAVTKAEVQAPVGKPEMKAVDAATLAQSMQKPEKADNVIKAFHLNEQQQTLVEIGSGGISAVKHYVAKYGHDIPDTILEPIRQLWRAMAFKKLGVVNPTEATASEKRKADSAARTKLTHIRNAVKGYNDQCVTVTDAVNNAKAGGTPRAKPTDKARMYSLVKQIGNLSIKDQTPEEKAFLQAVGVFMAYAKAQAA